MFLRSMFIYSLLAASSTALADSVDINLNNNSAQLQYIASMGHDTLGRAAMHAGFLYIDKYNQLADLGIQVKDEVGRNAPGLSVGVGIKGLTGKAHDNKGSALALGALARYAPFPDRRFGIAGQFYFSPNIVTFGDADRYIETGARVEYEIIPQASVYIGYRKFYFGLEGGSKVTLDESAMLGVRISF